MSKKNANKANNENNNEIKIEEPIEKNEEVKEKEEPEKKESIIEDIKIDYSVKNEKNSKNLIGILIVIALIIILIFGIKSFLNRSNSSKQIESVKRVLKAKYVDVECIDSYCNGIVAVKGDKLSKYTVELYNAEGKKTASYSEKYSSSSKSTRTPYQMSDSYFIMKIVNNSDATKVKYSINNKKGKELYTTDNKLTVLNDEFVLMEDDDTYSILDTKGTEKFNNISEIDTFYDDKYISIKIEDTYTILNEKGEQVLNNYKIAKEVKLQNDETAYFVVKDTKNDVYYYYDIKKGEVVGDSFESYRTGDDDGELIITKQVNDTKEKYVLSASGKQTKQDEVDLTSIKNGIDSDVYFLYSASVMKKDQKNVLVDNKAQKALGILNIETNKFSPLYSYKSDKTYFYSTVSKLNDDDDDNLYLKITCSEIYCDTAKTIIYDAGHTKEIYRNEDANLVVSDYISYESGYFVVKYSSSSKNEKYKNKYVLYNKNNKELYTSSNRIVLIDKKLEFGNEVTSSLTLYSTADNKALNEDNAASIIKVSDTKLYKYTDKNDNVVICNEQGKTVITSTSDNLKYSGSNIIYLENEKIYIYDASKNKTRKYKLKNNEKTNDAAGDVIAPYKGSVFINNSTDKYIKILDSKANVLKKINGVEISSVESNPKTGNVYIITKGSNKTGNLYGLYIAK